MSGPQFFETRMGHKFYDGTLPRIAKALERIAAALEQQQADAARPACARCGSTEGAHVPPGSADAVCLHCGGEWEATS